MNRLDKAFLKIVKKHGWTYFRPAKGSHQKWLRPDGKKEIVPIGSPCKHIFNRLLKEAGIKEKL